MHRNAGSLALGNIAGTNIVNIMLILGLSAAVRAIPFGRRTLVLDLPGMAIAAVLVLIFCLDGELQLWEGIPLVAGAVIYTVLLGLWTRRENGRPVEVPGSGSSARRRSSSNPTCPPVPTAGRPGGTRWC